MTEDAKKLFDLLAGILSAVSVFLASLTLTDVQAILTIAGTSLGICWYVIRLYEYVKNKKLTKD